MLKLLVFLPLLGSIFSGLFPAILGRKGSIWIPTLFCFVSLFFSIILLMQAIGGESYIVHRMALHGVAPWDGLVPR